MASLIVAAPKRLQDLDDAFVERTVRVLSRARHDQLPDVFDIQSNLDSLGDLLKAETGQRVETLMQSDPRRLSVYVADALVTYRQLLTWVFQARAVQSGALA